MRVLACRLIAALAARAEPEDRSDAREVTEGRELAVVPQGVGETARGYEAVGQVSRHPDTGEMVLVEQAKETSR